jgi:adenylate cyclase 8
MAVTTILLALALVMVMAEEFRQLPETLQTMSSVLMHHRNRRTVFICCVLVLMSFASSISLVSLNRGAVYPLLSGNKGF